MNQGHADKAAKVLKEAGYSPEEITEAIKQAKKDVKEEMPDEDGE